MRVSRSSWECSLSVQRRAFIGTNPDVKPTSALPCARNCPGRARAFDENLTREHLSKVAGNSHRYFSENSGSPYSEGPIVTKKLGGLYEPFGQCSRAGAARDWPDCGHPAHPGSRGWPQEYRRCPRLRRRAVAPERASV